MDQTVPASQLKTLSQRHKEALSLLAQGVKRQQVAEITEYTPEYLTWLLRQPLCRAYFQEISEVADARLLAMSDKAVDVLQETLESGSDESKLKAVRLQLGATGR